MPTVRLLGVKYSLATRWMSAAVTASIRSSSCHASRQSPLRAWVEVMMAVMPSLEFICRTRPARARVRAFSSSSGVTGSALSRSISSRMTASHSSAVCPWAGRAKKMNRSGYLPPSSPANPPAAMAILSSFTIRS